MAKKDRSSPPNASPRKRAKSVSPTAPAPKKALLADNLKITRAPRKRKPSDLNNQVTVHIISVPADQPHPANAPANTAAAASPAAATAPPTPSPAAQPPSTPAATARPAPPAASTPAPNAQIAAAATATTRPSLRLVTPPAPAVPAPPTAAAARQPTPPAGTPVNLGAPTPVHKSALNLSPMEQMVWAARLQKAKDVVAAQMKVRVNNGKLVRRYTAIDHDDGLFEIETAKGFYVVVLSKTGEYSIYWRHDRKAY